MFLYQSAYLDRNLYCAGYSSLMHHEKIIPHREVMYVNMHIRAVNWRFGTVELWHCYRMVRVVLQVEGVFRAQVAFLAELAFRAEVAWALVSSVCVSQVDVHLSLYVSSMSEDALWCHSGKEGIWPFGFDEASLGVFLSQPLPFYALETQHPTSSLLGLWPKVSWSNTVFSLLGHNKTCLWPFWPYSRPGACWTVSAVHDLLALP